MLKYLVVIGVIYIVYTLFIKKKPVQTKQKQKPEKLDGNDMVECDNCGIFVSIDEAIISNRKYYCSKTCLEKKS
jgi:uncharacterized protein